MKLSAYLIVPALLSAALAALSTFASEPVDPDRDYDRMDGTGLSGKKVDVVEWEGNLEIHVTPAGSLKGLALKIDRTNKEKPVMVIGYRFDNDPKKQLVRRAILGIDLHDGFKTYRDPSAASSPDGYDKIVISNNGLSSQMVAFALDPEPAQLYPDGHPALRKKLAESRPSQARKPAAKAKDELDAEPSYDEDGQIKPFKW